MELLQRIDQTRLSASENLEPSRRKELGQFMTPSLVGKFMASMFDVDSARISLLDAGAGVGSLTAAFAARSCQDRRHTHICVDAYEIDQALIPKLRVTLEDCRAACADAGIQFEWKIIEDDFVRHSVDLAMREGIDALRRYNAAILNPPYAKLKSSSASRKLLRYLGIETSNLYSEFVAVATKMLEDGGQIVAITPRSFCNGPYFKPFRYLLLESLRLRQIHVYESRNRAFREDDVLQENVIFHAERNGGIRDDVLISSCRDPADNDIVRRMAPLDDVVSPCDPEAFIHLATTSAAGGLARKARSLPCALEQLDLAVSTGRVVDFRARKFLRQEPTAETVPLVYPAHFESGFVAWPKKTKKANAIIESEDSMDLMVVSGCYVLTKRFSSKEERKRVVSAVYDPEKIPGTHQFAGFENHLNYYHENGRPMSLETAIGLSVFLNSSLVDEYFRQFSGHTQVNATDLRSLRYPDRDQLEQLANSANNGYPTQNEIDIAVNSLFS